MKFDGKTAGYLILRVALGAIFLFYGISKFQSGAGSTVDMMTRQFDRTFLPAFFVKGFGAALPAIEVAVGLLLLLGLFTRFALAVAGAVVVILTAGLALLGSAPTVATNLLFLLTIYVLLANEEQNAVSLDALRIRDRT
jgi:thiosulfate dehydrogenase [quinone] large subunit